MNRKNLLIATLVLLIGGGLGYWLGRSAHHSEVISTATDTEKKPLYWIDPMYPQQKFEQPGRSPFMDMDLVPVYAESGDASGITIAPSMQQNLGMRTVQAKRGLLKRNLRVPGTVVLNERSQQWIQATTSGFVDALHVRANLDSIKRGQPLLSITAPDWVAAQSEYLTLLGADNALAKNLRAASRQRLQVLGMPESSILALEKSRALKNRVVIPSPITGIVTELAVREGAAVSAGMPLLRVASLDPIWIEAEVPEQDSAALKIGAAVQIHTAALPGKVLEAQVEQLLAEVRSDTRTRRVRISAANDENELVPGMYVDIRMAGEVAQAQILLPSEAVIATAENSVVVVQQNDGSLLPMEVETGREADGQIEILRGLNGGEFVVASAQFLIDSEANLKGALQRLQPAEVSSESMQAHQAQGNIKAVSDNALTIAHGAVESLDMPAMTMDYRIPSEGLRVSPQVGDSVRFEFIQNAQGQFVLERVWILSDADSSENQSEASP